MLLKKALFSLLFFISVPVFGAQVKPVNVVVSIPPQKYFLEQIGGHHVNVMLMVPKGYEPEDYEPKPKQLKALSTAKLYFAIGVPFERTWLRKFQSVNHKLKIIHTEKTIQKMTMTSHDHHHVRHPRRHEIKDPHIWLSPTLVRLQAITIRDALVAADPEHANDYRQNYLNFASIISALDQDILALFSQKRLQGKRTFFIFHPAWGYFSRDYDLKQIAIEKDGKSPTIKQLAQVIKQAKVDNIRTIFISPEFSKKSAEAVAKAIKAHIGVLDPLSEQWDKNLKLVAQAIAASFNE